MAGQAALGNNIPAGVVVAGLLLCTACAAVNNSPPAQPADCTASSYDAQAQVERVIDGDTIVLSDSTHIRLLGIDTPEMGRRGKRSQPGARDARRYLQQLLPPGSTVQLKYDEERHDKHGRTLAHLFVADANVQATLLEQGLAVPQPWPPNLSFLDCYREASRLAEAGQKGLWARPEYQPQPPEQLSPDTRDYRVIRGCITRVKKTKASILLNMGDNLVLRIARKGIYHFPGYDLTTLTGTEVTARGKVKKRNKKLRIDLRHGSDLVIEKRQACEDI
ncbi:MAG: thermonuclease family protein [Gammaproteobacteria bacterium]